MAVLTRAQIENMSKEELVDELLKSSEISSKLDNLTLAFEEFTLKYNQMYSELAVVKKVNSLLQDKIVTLEKDQLNCSQYHRRELCELNPIPASIPEDKLEQSVCNALSLVGKKVTPSCLQSCHRLTNNQSVIIVKFKDRKLRQSVFYARSQLKDKKRRAARTGVFREVVYKRQSFK